MRRGIRAVIVSSSSSCSPSSSLRENWNRKILPRWMVILHPLDIRPLYTAPSITVCIPSDYPFLRVRLTSTRYPKEETTF